MNIEIKHHFAIDVYGFSGAATNTDYCSKAFELSDKTWHVVKENQLKNKGINVWIYDTNREVFAGVELDDPSLSNGLLEKKNINLANYAYYKHIGPYNLIQSTGQQMIQELKSKGHEVIFPSIEIYGHWTNDETKLETELLMCLK